MLLKRGIKFGSATWFNRLHKWAMYGKWLMITFQFSYLHAGKSQNILLFSKTYTE